MTWQDKIQSFTTSKEVLTALKAMSKKQHPEKQAIMKALTSRLHEINFSHELYEMVEEPEREETIEEEAIRDFITNNPFNNGGDIL